VAALVEICQLEAMSFYDWNRVNGTETYLGTHFVQGGPNVLKLYFRLPNDASFSRVAILLQTRHEDLPVSIRECLVIFSPLLAAFDNGDRIGLISIITYVPYISKMSEQLKVT
jgi:hypothetical protein